MLIIILYILKTAFIVLGVLQHTVFAEPSLESIARKSQICFFFGRFRTGRVGEKRGAWKQFQSLPIKENALQKANQRPILMEAMFDAFCAFFTIIIFFSTGNKRTS